MRLQKRKPCAAFLASRTYAASEASRSPTTGTTSKQGRKVMWRHKHRHIDRRPCFSFSVANPLRWALRRDGFGFELPWCTTSEELCSVPFPRRREASPFRDCIRAAKTAHPQSPSSFSKTEVSRGTSVLVGVPFLVRAFGANDLLRSNKPIVIGIKVKNAAAPGGSGKVNFFRHRIYLTVLWYNTNLKKHML